MTGDLAGNHTSHNLVLCDLKFAQLRFLEFWSLNLNGSCVCIVIAKDLPIALYVVVSVSLLFP